MTPQILQRPPESHASQSQFCFFFLRPSFCPHSEQPCCACSSTSESATKTQKEQLEAQQVKYISPGEEERCFRCLPRTFWGTKTGKTLPVVCPMARYRWPGAVEVREDEMYRGSTCCTAGAPLQVSPPGQVFLYLTFSIIACKVSSLEKVVLSSWIKSTRLWNVTGYINHTPWQVPCTEDDSSQGQGIKFHTTWTLVEGTL